jgi:hypothetical protein
MWPFSSGRVAFAYPTSSTFVATVCLGVAGTLSVVGALLYLGRFGLPAFWLIAPATLAFVAALAMGPGMREEFFVDANGGVLVRRVKTLWFPKDELIFGKGEIRLAAVATPRDAAGDSHGAYVVVVDQRGRWLALAQTDDVGRARVDRDRLAAGLGVPPVEVRCGTEWYPYWGRVQPPPPPEVARLGLPGAEVAGAEPSALPSDPMDLDLDLLEEGAEVGEGEVEEA